MLWNDAGLVESWVWSARMADLPRGTNRALVDRLFNGLPPYLENDDRARAAKTNVNWLEGARLAADARRSYYNAFLKPGNFFNLSLDIKPVHKRKAWEITVAHEWNKSMKGSRKYFEFLRSQFALTVLHGIGPGNWVDRELWVPRCLGVEDVLMPSNTLLTMENLNYFALFRQYTARELYEMTHGPHVDPGWVMPVVEGALKWADQQWQAEIGYNELYAPQKIEERWKQDLGFYGTDAVPTIDTWDFYFASDEDGQAGWRRRMILDTPTIAEVSGRKLPPKNLIGQDHGQWLYNPGDKRVYAEKIDQILHFQFGDATATAPFRYHSVRSLGWLLYAVCHLQNRLRCAVNDALFESLLQYFRASNPDDKERIEKIDLQDLGIIPEGLAFVTQAERWKVDQNLVSMGLEQNQLMMQESAAAYRQGRGETPGGKEKTATEIMAEVNSQNALVGAMLMQAYCYHKYQGMEIARRFCIKNSKDPDVRAFRNNVLKAGVPEEALDVSRWEVEPERVLGNGNKTLEIAMADKLMAARPLHDPESQREILYLYDMANSDNPDLAERLVPLDKQRVSDSVHDAQLALGSLMLGVKVPPVKGENPIEMIETLLSGLGTIMAPFTQGQAQPTPKELAGMANVILTIGEWVNILSEDRNEKERVKKYHDALAQADTSLKKMQQAAMKAQSQGGNGADPKDATKAQAMVIQAQTKAALQAKAHQQRTAERDVAFRMKQQQSAEQHAQDMQQKATDMMVDAHAEMTKNRLRSIKE